MPKRKKSDDGQPTKKQKMHSHSENSDKAEITKKSRKSSKEKTPWSDSDLLNLISKIEENIPPDDTVSYVCRLEKIDWSNIKVKSYSLQDCQQTWSLLLKQVRKFRLLKEIVLDMKNIVKTPTTPTKSVMNQLYPKPKQPPNSYMLFISEKRQEVTNKYPTLKSNDIVRKLGEMFKNLPSNERLRYNEKAQIARQEYLEKLQSFYSEHPELLPKKSKRSQSVHVEPSGPLDKPKTPFQLFVQVESEKPEAADMDKSTFNQQCKEKWKEMNDREKFFWINWAEEKYELYLEDLKEYLKTHPDYNPEKIKTILTKKEKSIKAYCSGKPRKPPSSPYHLFAKMIMESEEIKNINSREMVNYIAEKWKSCSEDEKKEYKIRIEQMWEDYHRKREEYLMTLPPEERCKFEMEEGARKGKTSIDNKTVDKKPQVKIKKPEVPPFTEYKYFLSVYKGKQNPLVVWENLTDEERDVFKKEFEKKRLDYIAQYEEYLKSLSKEELQKLGSSLGNQYDTSSESGESESESEVENN